MSPTQLTLRELRDDGFFAEVVEKRIPRVNITRDLFDWIDVVAVHPDAVSIIGIQTTTGDNAGKRLKKARGNRALRAWLKCGGTLLLHAWTRYKKKLKNGKWSKLYHFELVETEITEDML